MKTNIFKLRERDEKKKKIIIEEEKTKNPFLLFFIRHKMVFLIVIATVIILSLLLSVGFAFSLLRGSNNYDISYVSGSDKIDSNNNPNIKDEDIKKDLLGEESRADGVVVLVESVMLVNGSVIDFYTDGTAVIVKGQGDENGKIYRIFPKDDGSYGIDKSGKIDKNVKKILVEASTTTLKDGVNVTYYTDGTAKVVLNSKTIFVRDSNNIKTDNGSLFDNVSPSGVALAKNNYKNYVKYTDKSNYVISNGKKYVVNKNTEVSMNGDNISYDSFNAFGIIGEKSYKDGNTITVFENGAAVITDNKGNTLYVKKSGDILLKSKKLYEISMNEYGFSISNKNCSDGKKVVYFDNGSAVVIYPDGRREYVEDNDDIIYDSKKNISSNFDASSKTSEKITTNDEKVYNFSNGKSQVIRSNGSSYIIDTDKLTFKPTGEIDDSSAPSSPGHGSVNAGEGIYINEAENKYNDAKNVEDTVFIIQNKNRKSKKLRITIQEVNNYRKYNTSRLAPKFVKFQATIGDNYIPATQLDQNSWVDSDGVTNYIIYEGTIEASSRNKVALALYVDYANLDNSYQNKGFIGTIKIYVDDETD